MVLNETSSQEETVCDWCKFTGAQLEQENRRSIATYKNVEYMKYTWCPICGWELFEEPTEEGYGDAAGEEEPEDQMDEKIPTKEIIGECRRISAMLNSWMYPSEVSDFIYWWHDYMLDVDMDYQHFLTELIKFVFRAAKNN